MHHQGAGRRRLRRPRPRWPAQTRNEALPDGRRPGHPARPGLAPASRRDSPLLAPALGKLAGAGPLPGEVTVRPGAGYDSGKTRGELKSRSRNGEITRKGGKAPIQAGQRWHVGRTSSRHSSFNRLRRCYERNGEVTDAFFGLADTIITLRRLIREAWTLYRWDTRPPKRPWPAACPRAL